MKSKAIEILNNNWRNEFTVPSENLYPFQWKWDSGFTAIGLAHFNMGRAKKEISTLLDAQWENGLIPHIIFHTKSDTYFPGADFHCSNLHPKASKKYKSTGMSQPPVTGFVLQELYRISKDKTAILQYIESVIDKVYKNHNYLYENRDPKNEGLVYIYHNWESGTDNSPVWDTIFERMDSPEFKFNRKDTLHVDASQRPSHQEYNHYLQIIEIAKKYAYDDAKIAKHSPFLVQDPLFNTVLIKSNESLIKLYKLIPNSEKKIKQLKNWQNKAINRFNEKLYNQELKAYIYYDLRADKAIKEITSSSFAPIFAKIPSKKQVEELTQNLMQNFASDDYYLCASYNPKSSKFNPKKYWRGPVWVNLNWMLYKGLKEYGYQEIASQIKKDTLEIVQQEGFYEYFDPRKKEYTKPRSKAYGGENFSWTAALVLDLLNEN